jgi:hypothetical protein
VFVPFIFTLTTEDELRYLWIFYKYLDFAKKFGWPMISQAKYYEDPAKYEEMNRFEVFDPKTLETFKYEKPTEYDISLIQKHVIPDNLFDTLINELGSQSDSWVYILKNRFEPLENCLRDIFMEIISKNPDEKIEGILTFISIPSLLYVCEERQIPVLHNEMGPLRLPSYKFTAYLDFKGLFGNNELEDRYNKFCIERQTTSCPVLSRKEILSVFLDYEKMDAINLIDSESEFEMGIATQYALDFPVLVYGLNNNLDLILSAKRNYAENELILRMHPSDTSFSKYKTIKNIDTSRSSMEFVTKAKRIATISSNVAFEAMLWGKTVYTTGKGAYSFKALKNLSDKNENITEVEFINFVVFGYLIPYELMTDEKYLRWRLTYPTEIEIYNYHLNYNLSSRGIDKTLLVLPPEQRLYAFLESQGFDAAGEVLLNEDTNKRLISILNEAEKMSGPNNQAKYLITRMHQFMRINQKLRNDLENNAKNTQATLFQRDEHIGALLGYVSQLENTVKDTQATLVQRDEHIGALLKYVSQLENELNKMLKYVNQLENELNKIKKTTVWKLFLKRTIKI